MSDENVTEMTVAEQLLAACKRQHRAIDQLLAMVVVRDAGFRPSQSGAPWEALLVGKAAIERAEADPTRPGAVRDVYVFVNHQILVFDKKGNQIPALQGEDAPSLRDLIATKSDSETVWHEDVTWHGGPGAEAKPATPT